MIKKFIPFVPAWIAALIMLQTLYFKFTAHPESVEIFSTLGIEPYGRILSGVMELIAGLLLIIPITSVFGALIGFGIMIGAIISHLVILGIEINGDGGQLFYMALVVFICCSIVLYLRRNEVIRLIRKVR